MTLDELRIEAKKYGYRLTKIPEKKPKIQPCSCGRKQISLMERFDYVERNRIGTKTMLYSFKCPVCGKSSDWKTSEIDARKAWNIMIKI